MGPSTCDLGASTDDLGPAAVTSLQGDRSPVALLPPHPTELPPPLFPPTKPLTHPAAKNNHFCHQNAPLMGTGGRRTQGWGAQGGAFGVTATIWGDLGLRASPGTVTRSSGGRSVGRCRRSRASWRPGGGGRSREGGHSGGGHDGDGSGGAAGLTGGGGGHLTSALALCDWKKTASLCPHLGKKGDSDDVGGT